MDSQDCSSNELDAVLGLGHPGRQAVWVLAEELDTLESVEW